MSRCIPIGVSIALAQAEERYAHAVAHCDHMHMEDDEPVEANDPCCAELFAAAKDLARLRAQKRAEDHRL